MPQKDVPVPRSHFAENQSVPNPSMGLVISEKSPEPTLWSLCSFALKKILQANPCGDSEWPVDLSLERMLQEAATRASWLSQEISPAPEPAYSARSLWSGLASRPLPCPRWGKCFSCLQGRPVCPGVQSVGRVGIYCVWQSTAPLSTAMWTPGYRQDTEEEWTLHRPTWAVATCPSPACR